MSRGLMRGRLRGVNDRKDLDMDGATYMAKVLCTVVNHVSSSG